MWRVVWRAGIRMAQYTKEAKSLYGRIAKADQDNYPEMLGHICIINAPTVFKLIWSFAKSFLDVRTQGKIEVGGWVRADSVSESVRV